MKMGTFKCVLPDPSIYCHEQQHWDPLPLPSKRSSPRACFILHSHTQGAPTISTSKTHEYVDIKTTLTYRSKVKAAFPKKLQRKIKALVQQLLDILRRGFFNIYFFKILLAKE